jgi:hypothetical protein
MNVRRDRKSESPEGDGHGGKKPNRFQVTRIELEADRPASAANAMLTMKYTTPTIITVRSHR